MDPINEDQLGEIITLAQALNDCAVAAAKLGFDYNAPTREACDAIAKRITALVPSQTVTQ